MLRAIGMEWTRKPGTWPFILCLEANFWSATSSVHHGRGASPDEALQSLYRMLRVEVMKQKEEHLQGLVACQNLLDKDDNVMREVMGS